VVQARPIRCAGLRFALRNSDKLRVLGTTKQGGLRQVGNESGRAGTDFDCEYLPRAEIWLIFDARLAAADGRFNGQIRAEGRRVGCPVTRTVTGRPQNGSERQGGGLIPA